METTTTTPSQEWAAKLSTSGLQSALGVADETTEAGRVQAAALRAELATRLGTAAVIVNGSQQTAQNLADMINRAHLRGGYTVTVNGREVWSKYLSATVATVWSNGTLAVDVRGRTRGAQGTVWVKRGESVTVDA